MFELDIAVVFFDFFYCKNPFLLIWKFAKPEKLKRFEKTWFFFVIKSVLLTNAKRHWLVEALNA